MKHGFSSHISSEKQIESCLTMQLSFFISFSKTKPTPQTTALIWRGVLPLATSMLQYSAHSSPQDCKACIQVWNSVPNLTTKMRKRHPGNCILDSQDSHQLVPWTDQNDADISHIDDWWCLGLLPRYFPLQNDTVCDWWNHNHVAHIITTSNSLSSIQFTPKQGYHWLELQSKSENFSNLREASLLCPSRNDIACLMSNMIQLFSCRCEPKVRDLCHLTSKVQRLLSKAMSQTHVCSNLIWISKTWKERHNFLQDKTEMQSTSASATLCKNTLSFQLTNLKSWRYDSRGLRSRISLSITNHLQRSPTFFTEWDPSQRA